MSVSLINNLGSTNSQTRLAASSAKLNQTIQRLSSGLRINNSGDDAAGLAIANKYRSDIAVINQGVRNANDGLSNLQIIDGGLNTISNLLDRAATLAAQSASDTFTGNRGILHSEFSKVLNEISRQAQNIGLVNGGVNNKSLTTIIGGGSDLFAAAGTNNGVGIDLSGTVNRVDAVSLGLGSLNIGATSGAVTAAGGLNFGAAGAAINADESLTFKYVGASGTLSSYTVGLTSGQTANSIVNQLNNDATLGAAGISATVDSSGNLRLESASFFTAESSRAAVAGSTGIGTTELATGAANAISLTATAAVTNSSQNLTFNYQVNGENQNFILNVATSTNATTAADNLVTAINGNSTLRDSGIYAINTGADVKIVSTETASFSVNAQNSVTAGNAASYNSFGNTLLNSTANTGGAGVTAVSSVDFSNAAATITADEALSFQYIDAGGSLTTHTTQLTAGQTTAQIVTQLNTELGAAGASIAATVSGSNLRLTSTAANTYFSVVSDVASGAGSTGVGTTQTTTAGTATAAGGVSFAVGANTITAAETLTFQYQSGFGTLASHEISLGAGETVTNILAAINNDATLQAAGISAANNGGNLEISGADFFTVKSSLAAGATTTGIGNAVLNATPATAVHDSGNVFSDAGATLGADENLTFKYISNGTFTTHTVALTAGQSQAQVLAAINNDTTLQAVGISATATGSALSFDSTGGAFFSVKSDLAASSASSTGVGTTETATTGDIAGAGGVDFAVGANTITNAENLTFSFVNGSGALTSHTVSFNAGETVTNILAGINNDATLQAAGISAANSGGNLSLSSSNFFSVDSDQAAANQTGIGTTTAVRSAAVTQSFTATAAAADSTQKVTFTYQDAAGAIQNVQLDVATSTDATTAASNLVAAVNADTTLQASGIFAVSDGANVQLASIGVGGFSINPADSPTGNATANNSFGNSVTNSTDGTGSGGATGARAALDVLVGAIETLGQVQGVVGAGQNRLQQAIDLATSQINNFQAAESRVRDADITAEASNLSRLSVLQQAGVAALAQANQASQAVLSLLR